MRRLGLIGGVSPESTEIYVRLINRGVRARLGGERSATFIVWHMDYGRVAEFYRARDWPAYTADLIAAAQALKRAGAEAIMVGSNTSHLAAEAIGDATALPFLHVQDALVAAMRARGVRRPLLTGTKVTMDGPYYRVSLARRFDGDVATPTADEQDDLERIVFDELCMGVVAPASRARLKEIVAAHSDCDGIILGCTELSLILSEGEVPAPVFDTTALHAAAGVDFALAEG